MKSTCPMPAPRLGDPTPPIFHLLALVGGLGGNANFSVRVGGNANFSVIRYQHVIPNAKLWHWGSKPTLGANAKLKYRKLRLLSCNCHFSSNICSPFPYVTMSQLFGKGFVNVIYKTHLQNFNGSHTASALRDIIDKQQHYFLKM